LLNSGNDCQRLPLTHALLAGVLALGLSACGGSAGSSSADNTATNNTSEMVIANALYFDKRTPADFYTEDFQADTFYSVSHVKNTSLLPVAARSGLSVHELASNDFVEALTWSDKAAEFQQSYKQLAANTETMLYFQFTRFDPASPQFLNLHRVFKASVLDRTGVDRNDTNASYKGRITMPNPTAADVKLIIEYLWMFTASNNYRNAVLESYTTETDTEFVHIMKQARLNLDYTGGCDTIEVYDVSYRVPKDSGFIWKEKVLTTTFSAKRTDSYLEICQ
jgi:hypothetical protein